jgi:dual specificity tyrosine-phosphorylation-regulated kinase 2/3/4
VVLENNAKCKYHVCAAEFNRGFDDERGDYKPVVHDHLAYRYEILSILGKGSFGQVLKVFDYKDQALRAVKIIRNKARFHEQAKVELTILHHLVNKVS